MKDHSYGIDQTSSSEEILIVIDDEKLPELIHNHIGKLVELDAGVKKALEIAENAERRAHSARNLSAGWSLLGGKKKEAIEGLQEASVELAEAVQLGAQAQKISYEFQARLAEVTKSLFELGTGNIAATRMVVRGLEMRLRGASEEELSDLARMEVASVIRQLKEQEDLHFKQQKMTETLRESNVKIDELQYCFNDLGISIKSASDRHRTLAGTVDAIEKVSEQRYEEVSILQKQTSTLQSELDTISVSISQINSQMREFVTNIHNLVDNLNSQAKAQDVHLQGMAGKIEALEQASQAQKAEFLNMKQQILTHQTAIRWSINVRSVLICALATALSLAIYLVR